MASGMAESASCVVPLAPPPAPTAVDCCPPSPRLAVRAAGPPPPAVAAAPSPAAARLGHDATPALTAAVGAFLSAVVAPPLPTQHLELFGRRADDRAAVRAEIAGRYVSPEAEATLRVDTELELLRRRCFAERNARWQFATPDTFAWTPVADAPWTPRPANDKLALRDLAADLDRAAAIGVPPPRDGGGAGATLSGFPLGEFVRDRPWPPKEFALKPAAKPRGRGGKRKAAAAALLPPPPLLAKMCVDCHTQSTPLWRSRIVVHPSAAAAVVQPVVNAVDATVVAAVVVPEPAPVKQQELDLCLTCYLKTERRDLMDRKKAELARRAREKVAVAAAEKKRQQHQAQQLKKQKQQALKSRQRDAMAALVGPTSASSLALVESNGMVDEGERNGVILKFTRQEVEAAMDKKAVKKERRRSHHRDKKKKKKKKRSHEKLHHPEESESDGLTPLPSPPQMAAYEYADIKHEVDSMEAPQSPVTHEETASIATLTSPVSRSSKKPVRDEKGKFVSSSSSSSKKRKSEASVVETPVAIKSGRSSRAKSSSAATPTAPAPTPTASSGGRKRARTKKKESSRERELRALGQYCPVCNEVYEDDDESSFVCCDSCEMWVHAACDASLTPEAVAALANSNDKYICPLCSGR